MRSAPFPMKQLQACGAQRADPHGACAAAEEPTPMSWERRDGDGAGWAGGRESTHRAGPGR